MRWIIETSLRLRAAVATAAVLLLVFGFMQLGKAPVDALPEFSRPYVELQVEAPGLSAQEVEALITTPLEADMLNGLAWAEGIRSVSIPGLASIVLIFEKGTDIMRARQMVQERLTEIFALPKVAKNFTMINPVSSTSRVMAIGLTSKELSLIQMSVLARWTIQPRLLGVPGVANVSIWGKRERQLQVQVNPEKLRDEHVTLMQVIKTAGNALWASPLSFLEASTPGTGGWVDTPNQRLAIRHLLPITTAEHLAKVPVEDASSKRLGDVANVVEDHQPLIGDAIVKDGPALTLVVEKFPWANTQDVTRGLEQALAALRPGLAGLEMDSSLFRPATYLQVAVGNFKRAWFIGVGLAVVALGAFLFNWRTALIGTVAMLLSVIAAGTVLSASGVTINMMIMAGLVIALVLVIDDAVVDAENTARRLRRAREEGKTNSSSTIIFNAAVEMRVPLLYATVIMVLAAVPALLLEGVSGAFLRPLAVSYVLALLASMLVALTVTPVLSLLFLRNASLQNGDALARMLRHISGVLFGWAARAPRAAFVAVCAVALAGLVSMSFLRQESLLPPLKETDLVVRFDGVTSASHPAMSRIATLASRELRSIPGVNNVSAQVGRAIMSDKRTNVNSGELWVSIDPSADYGATVARVKDVVAGYPGLSPEVLTYLQAQVRKELSGTAESLVVRVYGEDMGILTQKADEVQAVLAGIGGVVEAKVQYPKDIPTVEIEVNIDKAQRFGLKPGDIRRTATSVVSGLEVGNLFEEQKVFEVVVWGAPSTRRDLTGIQNLLIDTPAGGHVRLRDVADVRVAPAPAEIHRDAAARSMDVTASVRGRDLVDVAAEVQRGLQRINFPLEYRAELLGEYADRLAAQKRLLVSAIAAAIGIILLLQAFFQSWPLATAVFLTLPMALVGGVLAVFVTGSGLLSLGAIVGFLAVLGMAVRNAMTLIGRYRYLELHEGHAFGAELVRRGTEERAAPILMTAIAAALAFIPVGFFGSIAGLEIVHPVTVVILGGLVTATLFALAGIPAIYLLFGAAREPELGLEEPLAGVAADDASREVMAGT